MFWTYEYLQFDCNRNILYIKIFLLHVKVEIYTIIIYILEWNIFITLYVYMHVYIYILFKHLYDSWVLKNL